MINKQPEALIFANDRPSEIGDDLYQWASDAEDMIRRQHARIVELEAQLAAAQRAVHTAVPEAIEQMAVDRYKVVPSHESMFHRWAVVAGNGTQQLYIGREGECQNMARKFMGAFLDGSFVAMQNAATAHPAESVPAQIETLRSELAEEKEAADNWRRLALQFDIHRLQALWHLKRILHADSSVDEYKEAEQFLAAPPLDGEAVLAQRIAALAATQPAPAIFGDEDHVLVPRGLIGAACYAIDKKRDGTKTLAELRRYTTGDLSAATQPAQQGMDANDADMFWNDDDSEQQYGSIEEFLNDEICNGYLEVGHIRTMQRGIRLPNIYIRVTAIDEEESEATYEIIDAALAAQAKQ